MAKTIKELSEQIASLQNTDLAFQHWGVWAEVGCAASGSVGGGAGSNVGKVVKIQSRKHTYDTIDLRGTTFDSLTGRKAKYDFVYESHYE